MRFEFLNLWYSFQLLECSRYERVVDLLHQHGNILHLLVTATCNHLLPTPTETKLHESLKSVESYNSLAYVCY